MQVVRTESAGGNATIQTVDVPLLAAIFAPVGSLAANQPVFDAMLDSVRVTPEWSSFVTEYRRDLLRMLAPPEEPRPYHDLEYGMHPGGEHDKAMKIAQAHMQDYIGDRPIPSDDNRNRADALRDSAQQFALHMGDLALFQTLSANATQEKPAPPIQLSGQYSHVWAGPDRQFLLSDSPTFDSNLNEKLWTPMQPQH